MVEFLKALKIFTKYINRDSYGWKYPFTCEHEILYVTAVNPRDVSQEDIEELESLGFEADIYEGIFYSTKYGSS